MFKYIYFNHMNLAQQTTVHMDLQKRAGINIPQEIMRLLSDINADLTKCVFFFFPLFLYGVQLPTF